jgi:hypothetical protein
VSTTNLLRAAIESSRLDASALDSAGTRTLAAWVLSLDDQERLDVLDKLEDCPNFVGSDLFDQVVDDLEPAYRRRMWDTGHATIEQASRRAHTETDRRIRQVLVLNYGLELDDVDDLLLDDQEWTSKGMWRRILSVVADGHADRLPTRVLVRWVQKAPKRVGAEDAAVMDDFIIGNTNLTRTLAADPNSSQYSRLLACANPNVSAHDVRQVLTGLTREVPAGNLNEGLYVLLERRPVMTEAELDAVRELALVAELEDEMRRDIAQRHGWELSDREFLARVEAATSSQELTALAGLVPAHRWGGSESAVTKAVAASPHASPDLAHSLCAYAAPMDVLNWWTPTTAVWGHQPMLREMLATLEPAPGWPYADLPARWASVLGDEAAAATFTQAAIDNPATVMPDLWTRNVLWVGDLEALALGVPAWALSTVGCGRLQAAVLNVLSRADNGTGTIWEVVSSFAGDAPASEASRYEVPSEPSTSFTATLADVLTAHAAAVA